MRQSITAMLILATFLVCAQAYSADMAAPPRFPLETAPTPTMKSAPVTSVRVGGATIVLDQTTLGDAKRDLNAGVILHKGDAGESMYWLCYSHKTAEGWEQLWLLSHGEMGGNDHVIGSIAARLSSSPLPTEKCPVLRGAPEPIGFNNRIRLGVKAEILKKALGKPSLAEKGWLHYESQRELVGDPRAKDFGAEKIYELGGLSARIRAGKAIEIWATKQISD